MKYLIEADVRIAFTVEAEDADEAEEKFYNLLDGIEADTEPNKFAIYEF